MNDSLKISSALFRSDHHLQPHPTEWVFESTCFHGKNPYQCFPLDKLLLHSVLTTTSNGHCVTTTLTHAAKLMLEGPGTCCCGLYPRSEDSGTRKCQPRDLKQQLKQFGGRRAEDLVYKLVPCWFVRRRCDQAGLCNENRRAPWLGHRVFARLDTERRAFSSDCFLLILIVQI